MTKMKMYAAVVAICAAIGMQTEVSAQTMVWSQPCEFAALDNLSGQTVLGLSQQGDFARLVDLKGKPAPDFALPNEQGKTVRLKQYYGKWVVIDFWASWCGWCIKGIPDLKKAYSKYSGKAVFISIDCNDSRQTWLSALEKHQMPWVQLFAGDGSATAVDFKKTYGIHAYPTKMIISPQGKVMYVLVGEKPEFYTELDRLLR